MKALRLTLAALLCSAPLLAAAQWQWIDKDGRKVFSDQPPPADVPAGKILRQPGARAAAAPAADAPAPTAAAAPRAEPNGLKVTGKDKDLENRKKQADAEAAAKKKADEEKVAAAKAENCTRAKASKAGFDSGVRIARTNAQGEREILDDSQRAAEVRRLQMIIDRDCPKT